jgi:hypothetical protein
MPAWMIGATFAAYFVIGFTYIWWDMRRFTRKLFSESQQECARGKGWSDDYCARKQD